MEEVMFLARLCQQLVLITFCFLLLVENKVNAMKLALEKLTNVKIIDEGDDDEENVPRLTEETQALIQQFFDAVEHDKPKSLAQLFDGITKEILKVILQRKNNDGKTLLLKSTDKGHQDLISIIIDKAKEADILTPVINASDDEGLTALHINIIKYNKSRPTNH